MVSTLDILLVDDSPGDRELVAQMLPRGSTVRQATTAEQAREAVAERTPDLVLLDYRLPDAEGTALLPLFIPLHIPVVMLTGMEAAEIVVESMHGGALDYLVKNQLTEEVLHRTILNAMEKARLKRAVQEQQDELIRQARALEVKNREISHLAGALTLAEQEERRRVATLLHDHVQQQLFGAKLGLSTIVASEDPDARRAAADHVESILNEAIEATRNLAVELTPPVMDREELAVGLEWVAQRVKEQHGLDVQIEAEDDCRVPARELRVLLLQLVKELLFNVVKHAEVDHAVVRLSQLEDCYLISVIDSGRGFEPDEIASILGSGENHDSTTSQAFGLYSVRERLKMVGGHLEIDSRPGGGARVTIRAPIAIGQAVAQRPPDLFSKSA